MIGNSWDDKLSIVENSEGFKKFVQVINNEYNTKTIYPPKLIKEIRKKFTHFLPNILILMKNLYIF